MKSDPTVILLTGFLGSGKTTVLLRLVDVFLKKGKKCAIIQNEIGDVGIDNYQMKKMGYDVYDLFGGCVCCSLKVTLQATLLHLKENYDLDIIFFEPSGLSDPEELKHNIDDCKWQPEAVRNIFICDPLRFDLYQSSLKRNWAHALQTTTDVLVNKIDIAPEETLDSIRKILEAYPTQKPVYYWHNSQPLPDKLLESLM